MEREFINFGEETRLYIETIGFSIKDVSYVIVNNRRVTLEYFLTLADNVEYAMDDFRCKPNLHITNRVFIVFKGEKSWLERESGSSSEYWKLVEHPAFRIRDDEESVTERDLLYLPTIDLGKGTVIINSQTHR